MEEQLELTSNNKKKKKKLLLPLLFLLIAAVAGVGAFLWYQNRMDDMSKYWFDKTAKDGTLKGKTPAELQDMLNTIVEEGMFNVSMNVQPVFEDGKSKGSLGVENIEANKYYCRVVLTLDQDGRTLFKSEGLKPGQYIDEIKLEKELKKGVYPCTAQFIATDPDTLDDIGSINVKVTLTVQN